MSSKIEKWSPLDDAVFYFCIYYFFWFWAFYFTLFCLSIHNCRGWGRAAGVEMSLQIKLRIIWWFPIHPTLSQTHWVWWTGKWWRESFRSFWAVAKPGWAQEWKAGRLLLEFTLCPLLCRIKATGQVKEMWKRESRQAWEEALVGIVECPPIAICWSRPVLLMP